MVDAKQGTIRNHGRFGESDPMHRESQSDDKPRVEESGQLDAGDAFAFCACGCGRKVFRDKRGRQGKWIIGHHVKRRTREEWGKRYEEALSAVPLCACGCGEKTRLHYGESLDQFIRNKGDRSFYIYKMGHHKRSPEFVRPISEKERQAILGTLLGDSSLLFAHSRSTKPRFMCNHGGTQEEWAKHKAEILSGVGATVSFAKNAGYGSTHVRVTSKGSVALGDIYALTHPGGKKSVSREWLDGIGEIGLAWWICDDGSCHGRGAKLHTEGFSLEENRIIADWMSENYGPAYVAHGGKGHWNITVSADAQRSILPVVESYIPECMQYKLGSYRVCAATKNPRNRVRHYGAGDR